MCIERLALCEICGYTDHISWKLCRVYFHQQVMAIDTLADPPLPSDCPRVREAEVVYCINPRSCPTDNEGCGGLRKKEQERKDSGVSGVDEDKGEAVTNNQVASQSEIVSKSESFNKNESSSNGKGTTKSKPVSNDETATKSEVASKSELVSNGDVASTSKATTKSETATKSESANESKPFSKRPFASKSLPSGKSVLASVLSGEGLDNTWDDCAVTDGSGSDAASKSEPAQILNGKGRDSASEDCAVTTWSGSEPASKSEPARIPKGKGRDSASEYCAVTDGSGSVPVSKSKPARKNVVVIRSAAIDIPNSKGRSSARDDCAVIDESEAEDPEAPQTRRRRNPIRKPKMRDWQVWAAKWAALYPKYKYAPDYVAAGENEMKKNYNNMGYSYAVHIGPTVRPELRYGLTKWDWGPDIVRPYTTKYPAQPGTTLIDECVVRESMEPDETYLLLKGWDKLPELREQWAEKLRKNPQPERPVVTVADAVEQIFGRPQNVRR